MNTSQKYSGVLAGIAVVIAIVALFFHGSSSPELSGSLGATGVADQNQTNYSNLGTKSISIGPGCQNGYAGATCIGNGATSLADFSLNQVLATSTRVQLNPGFATNYASTTFCAILSPAATSSLTFADINVTSGTSTAFTLAVGTSSSNTAFSTTSSIGTLSVASSAQGSWTFDPTISNAILAPSQWIVVGETGGPLVIGGTCQYSFTLL